MSDVIKNKMAAIKVKFAQHAPIELKFAWNDPCGQIKNYGGHRSKGKGHLRGQRSKKCSMLKFTWNE